MKVVVALLVAGRYADLCRITGNERLTADEIETAIKGYPGKMVMPPERAFEALDKVVIKDSIPARWSIVMPLWTDRVGRSDLSLEATLTETDRSHCLVKIDAIRVR